MGEALTDAAGPGRPRQLALALAPCCRRLRDAVLSAVRTPGSPLKKVASEWRDLLLADGDDDRFADAYAQTVTYGLLMARLEGGLERSHSLLARVLQTLTRHRTELLGPLEALERTIAAVDVAALARMGQDPWLYFYEDFLAAYDPKLRNDVGAYYTPREVVRAQVTLVREVLELDLAKPLGFGEPDVTILDPACGTGTYPHYIITDTLERVRSVQGEEAVQEVATRLARNLRAFELLVAPYAVAHLRLTEALLGAGATLPEGGAHVFLIDALDSPAPGARAPRSVQGRVLVCIGNPPYDRQEIDRGEQVPPSRRGGWVRFGDGGAGETLGILRDFLPPRGSPAGADVKNVYNDYVYFWRWALWKVFEQSNEGGVVSFITAASYLRGKGFVAMRRHMRKVLDELWIIDLGGAALGPRKSSNVFAITTPVCIAVALRRGKLQGNRRAKVWYTKLPEDATREAKLATLAGLRSFRDLVWQRAPDEWEAPFVPAVAGEYATWPRLTDLFPWQHSGVQWKRTWPVGETSELLARRWQALLAAKDRRLAFRETAAWTLDKAIKDAFASDKKTLPPLSQLPRDAASPPVVRYAWRALDRQWCLRDPRLADRLRPELWMASGPRQIFLTSLLTNALGTGPALVATAAVPDLHHFRGSFGGKDVIPLWRDAGATRPNVTAGLLEFLRKAWRRPVTPEDLLAYVYGVMAHPGFTACFVSARRREGAAGQPDAQGR